MKYIDMLLYFYACYSITQTIFRLDAANKLNDSLENPESLYFILDNESASERRDVVKQGWATKLPSEYVSKLYGRMQAVDMLNILLMDNENTKPIGLYKNLLDKIKETPFDYEIKNQCEKLLEYCKIGKYNALKKRTSGKKVDEIKVISDLSVNSYEDFF
ncbi:DNA phosphorothioation-dependent restriction protein DptG [Bacteroides thetaiotaomicron]|uniref:DNA phosphorothioation-dependent restriction protein DptG n=1 Tax=Bacteroides thetaiotaomicron TaxID=818 RepID=UPI0039C4B6C9